MAQHLLRSAAVITLLRPFKKLRYMVVRIKSGDAFADIQKHLSQFNDEREAHIACKACV